MKLREISWALAVALLFCVTATYAQDQKQDSQQPDPNGPIQPINSGLGGAYGQKPAPAARGVSSAFDSQPYDPSQVTPDPNTLAGAEFFSVGSLEHSHNIFDPSISLSQLGETINVANGQSNLTAVSLLGGSLNFNRTWSRYHLTTIYDGGETFDIGQNNAGVGSSHYPFHNLIFTQEADWARWHVLLRDDFMAAPGAAFTGTGMGGPGLVAQFSSMVGVALNNLAQTFLPAETIETGNAMRYRNAVLGQAEYSLSRRSAFTFSGSYGLLHFSDAGYVSSRMMDAQAGYDYILDPMNSVAILASYGKIDYTGAGVPTSDSTTDYMAALAYGRKVTGRLAFQVAAGPQEIHSTGAVGGFQHLLWSVNSALTYDRRRSGVSFSYLRGLTAGSGVFLGATSNTFAGSAHYQFTRFWTGTVNGGYALNNSLVPAGTASTNFDNWFVGANLGRVIGPHIGLNFNYGLQRQNTSGVCPVTSCGISGFQQTFGMTVNWHLRPAG